jgi:hypothetical protein
MTRSVSSRNTGHTHRVQPDWKHGPHFGDTGWHFPLRSSTLDLTRSFSIRSPTPCPTMTDTIPDRPALPDRLSIDERSPHHVAAVFEHDVGIRFNGKDRLDVVEYCVSEGWVRVPAGKTLDRKGNPLLIKLNGTVEAFYR